jgi:hypothetical protein
MGGSQLISVWLVYLIKCVVSTEYSIHTQYSLRLSEVRSIVGCWLVPPLIIPSRAVYGER